MPAEQGSITSPLSSPRPAFGHLAAAGVARAEKQDLQFRHWRLHSSTGSIAKIFLRRAASSAIRASLGQRLGHPRDRFARRRRARPWPAANSTSSARPSCESTRPGLVENGQMLGDGGRGQAEQLRDLAHAQLPLLQGQEHPHAVLIRQRFGHGHELTQHHTLYFAIRRNIVTPSRSVSSTAQGVFRGPGPPFPESLFDSSRRVKERQPWCFPAQEPDAACAHSAA